MARDDMAPVTAPIATPPAATSPTRRLFRRVADRTALRLGRAVLAAFLCSPLLAGAPAGESGSADVGEDALDAVDVINNQSLPHELSIGQYRDMELF